VLPQVFHRFPCSVRFHLCPPPFFHYCVWPSLNLFRPAAISLPAFSHATYSSPWWRRQQAPLKRRAIPTRLHGATSQKMAIFIRGAVKTWNLTCISQVEW
jgi:hypothetical protein